MLKKLLSVMEEKSLDGFFISKIHNVRYVSKYTSDDAYLLVTTNKNYFITDPRYTEQAQDECKGFEVVNWRTAGKSISEAIANLANGLNLKSVAFEADNITFLNYSGLSEKIEANLIPLTNVIEDFRSVKTPEEIQNQRVSCQIACRAFERILKDIKVGVSEKEIAAKLSYYMVSEGSDSKPYGDIVISGKRTSLLHGIPSDKKIEEGDFVLMDFGCGYKGYLSDMTRTVMVGKASDKQKEVYRLEQQMLQDALDVMKAGATSKDIYEASIKAIKDTEYYEYHYNNIGHGIGLFVHEIPFMGANSQAVLFENNVTTMEPGIYIPNWGGVRIEDQVLITKDGYENLVTAPKELIEL